MKISLHHVKPNHTEVNVGGAQLVFSYNTLVAFCDKSGKRYQTGDKFSTTTTKHINASGYASADKVDQNTLEAIAAAGT
jgi:hypothetical protein